MVKTRPCTGLGSHKSLRVSDALEPDARLRFLNLILLWSKVSVISLFQCVFPIFGNIPEECIKMSELGALSHLLMWASCKIYSDAAISRTIVFKYQHASEPPGKLIKILGSALGVSDSVGLRSDPRLCIPYTSPGNADVWRPHFNGHCCGLRCALGHSFKWVFLLANWTILQIQSIVERKCFSLSISQGRLFLTDINSF